MRPFVRKSSKRAAVAVSLVVGTVYMLEALKIRKKEERFSVIIEDESKLWQGA
ncbi:hypothetical protein BC939DRAFT_498596 [Gamsiella multidivaricata]|uniref:uncharacterized protein n=1 Tax=Gamsiella multidivaricata TaxID=101098 RepID=UPI00221E790A|nr:uncharacterized protein BC939DRAFT_498596 [Gamsiella multidivaricata]KAI7831613.1 hypothetical protein BC939DRAFT_498596 [Gamsiella multidivaricata]